MNRRTFLQTAVAAGCALNTPRGGAAAEPGDKLILSAPLTHSDWMLRDKVPGVVWGPEGVKHMLDACKACGWSRIYWRCFDGGRSTYKSRLIIPGLHLEYDTFYNPNAPEDLQLVKGFYPDFAYEKGREVLLKQQAQDYSTFDSLAAAVSYGHQIGLQIHAWISINEDDHGWGVRSDFSLKHPEFRWRKRSGTFYRSQISFAFPEALEYKIELVKELVEGYDIDGIFLDWIRTGDVRDDPQADPEGVADRGYEEIAVQGFKVKYGVDPHDIPNSDEAGSLSGRTAHGIPAQVAEAGPVEKAPFAHGGDGGASLDV